jgi:hypothetical protein
MGHSKSSTNTITSNLEEQTSTNDKKEQVVVFVLGSGFDESQETGYEFIKELVQKKMHVDVYSIDKDATHSTKKTHPIEGVHLHRLQLDLNKTTVDSFLSAVDIGHYNKIILIDGITYLGHSPNYQLLVDKIQEINEKHVDCFSLHYISPRFENPRINSHSVDPKELGIKLLDYFTVPNPGSQIHASKFNEKNYKAMKNFFHSIDTNSHLSSKERSTLLDVFFMRDQTNFPEDQSTPFRTWLNNQILSKLSIDTLKLVEIPEAKQEKKASENSHDYSIGHKKNG